MDKQITLGISKFNNIGGVTCYMNSILAILQQTPIFTDYILNGFFKDNLLKKNKDIVNCIIYQLYALFKLSHENDNANITPNTFRRVITMKDDMWGQQQQQDSQEFFTFLLSQLENEVSTKVEFIGGLNFTTDIKINNLYHNSIQILAQTNWIQYIKNEYSLIKTLFTGMTRMTTTCKYCSSQTNNFDIFQTLQLSIPANNTHNKKFSLDDCLDHFTENEILDKQNMMECNFCYRKNQSTKKTILWKTPKILILHIKRFIVNYFGIPTQKLNNMVEYPLNLNIKKYIDPLSPDYQDTNYTLFAVNCHHSLGSKQTINSGHYTSIVKNRYDDCWYEFDDNNVRDTSNIVNGKAYMLFYELN
jgi:ubiquitin C-terminal hydrolase